MPRPKKCRRICAVPERCAFGPVSGAEAEEIEMTMDEYETIRLIDVLDYTQEMCAKQMGVPEPPCRRCTMRREKSWHSCSRREGR